MTCERLTSLLDAHLDGRLDEGERAAVERHLTECASCRSLADDIARIRAAAGALPRHPVPPLVWPRLAASLRADPSFGIRNAATPARSIRTTAAWLALAAGLVAAAGSGLLLVRSGGDDPAAVEVAIEGDPDTPALVNAIGSELASAAAHYENAVTGLEQLSGTEDSPLDPAVVATLRANIAIIDQAIDESRAALAAQPESSLAQQSLLEAFRRKMSLLQDTIALMNEVRKGNEAGAARIVGALDPS